MSDSAVSIEGLWKSYRLYRERHQYLKSMVLHGKRARFDEFWALKDISFQIPQGETFGIIGSNGSGKSSLLKCLAAILTPDRGSITVEGRISALLELGAGFHPDLTGRENVFLNGAILGMSSRQIERDFADIVDFADLGQFIDTPVKNYSSGMVVRLGFAIATNVNPDVLIIDEVLAVGDETFQQRCFEKIETFRKDGKTIVLVSHGLSQITQLCTSSAWIDKGRLRKIGPSLEVVSEYTSLSHEARPKTDSEELGDRWGTSEALITGVEFLGVSEIGPLRTGERVTLRISYSSMKKLENVVVGIRFTHIHGAVIWGSNTKRQGMTIPQIDGEGFVEIEIHSLPLLEGTFDLTIALSDYTELHEYDHWERKVRFSVSQIECYDEGLVRFDSKWSINQ